MPGLKSIFNSPELIKKKKLIHNSHERATIAIAALGLDDKTTGEIFGHIKKNYIAKVQEVHNEVDGDDVDITPVAKEVDADAAPAKKTVPKKSPAKKSGGKKKSGAASELD